MITKEKWQALHSLMSKLGIDEDDISEKFILASGSGGQKLQKTSSCVHLVYQPANIIIKCSESRSREQNRFHARRRLCEKIESIQLGEQSRRQQQIAKIRRQKAKRSKRAKQKILDDKRHQSKAKSRRKKPDIEKD